MQGYTKLFSSIVTSTIWNESKETKIVWITLLALADQNGVVESSIPGLAVVARVSVDECRASIAVLLSPDPDSRTKDHDGRRIQEIDGGWLILNHAKYREKLSKEERREYKRQWDRTHRVRHESDKIRQNPTLPTQADTEADTESKGTDCGDGAPPDLSVKKSRKDCETREFETACRLLREWWVESYKTVHGIEQRIVGPNWEGAKKLMRDTGLGATGLIEIAKRAWGYKEGFYCSKLDSLSFYANHFNEIQKELKDKHEGIRNNTSSNRSTPSDERNRFIGGGKTDLDWERTLFKRGHLPKTHAAYAQIAAELALATKVD